MDPGPRLRLSSAFRSLPGYPLADVPEIRRRLRSEGVDVIDLGAGDSDLPPPPAVVERMAEAVRDPDLSRYPFQLGLPAFREAVAEWMKLRFGVHLDPFREILPLIGSKEGIAKLPLAVLEPGDRAVVPDPGYQAYGGGVALAKGEPVRVPLRPENDFLIPLGDLPARARERVRILYLNYPNNPTAATASPEYLAEAVAWCRRREAILVHDAAYSEFAFDGYRPPSALEVEGSREWTLEFHSLSKTYNMTGWRLGWAAGGARLIEALSRVKTFMDTGAFLAVQSAGVAALESWESWVPENMERFRRRRDAGVEELTRAGFQVRAPAGTMYLWVPVPGEEAESFTGRALEEQGVVLLPGSALGEGGEGFFRVALTVSEERLREAGGRLAEITGPR